MMMMHHPDPDLGHHHHNNNCYSFIPLFFFTTVVTIINGMSFTLFLTFKQCHVIWTQLSIKVSLSRHHLREEYLRTSATSEVALQQAAEEEAEHQRLMEYNRMENERIAALREIRYEVSIVYIVVNWCTIIFKKPDVA